MFYDKDLMNSKSLGKVWRAGNRLNYDSDEEITMTTICDKLDAWVGSENEEVHRRLSLRTSAVLVDGVTRVYKRKMETLFEDIERLDREMALPKRNRYIHDNFVGRADRAPDDSDSSNIERILKSTTSNEGHSTNHSSLTNNDVFLEETDDSSENYETQQVPDIATSSSRKVDKEVQTCLEDTEPENTSLDRNLPFGYIVIHDNYHSRVPSKIMIATLNPDVLKLT